MDSAGQAKGQTKLCPRHRKERDGILAADFVEQPGRVLARPGCIAVIDPHSPKGADIIRYDLLSAIRLLVVLLLAGLMLNACAGRPGPQSLRLVNDPKGTKMVTIYVATSRQWDEKGDAIFSNGVSIHLNFAAFTISIPPGHKPGEVEYPGATPDPSREFVVVARQRLDRAGFEAAINKASGGLRKNIDIFVHGYNTNFPEALFRQAQIVADAGTTENDAAILFSWPSYGNISGYLADMTTATASRDQLVELLAMTTGKHGARGDYVTLAAHSMGGWLTAEALRQLRLQKRDDVLSRLKVVLAAPDIAGSVFQSQMQVIGRLPIPMTILVSRDDIALSVSSFIAGNDQRIGNLDVSDPTIQQAARDANVQIIDITSVATNDTFRHNRFATLAEYYPMLRAQEHSDEGAGLRSAGIFVFDALAQTLTAPFSIGKEIVTHL